MKLLRAKQGHTAIPDDRGLPPPAGARCPSPAPGATGCSSAGAMGRSHPGRCSGFGIARLVLGTVLPVLLPATAPAEELLPGEFGEIDLGRPLVEPARFPTIRQLREAVRRPEIRPVLMFKLFSSGDNHHLPIWSGDGRRLAFQRSDLSGKSSKLLVFGSTSQAQPTLLTDRPEAYDYMFRWAVNGPASYSFVRIDSGSVNTRVQVAIEGGRLECRTPEPGRRESPALYRRSDGIWRLVYGEKGDLIEQAWGDSGSVEPPLVLARGSSPRWSRDGHRLLLVRERSGGRRTPTYDVLVRNLRAETEVILAAGTEGMVRSPTWSPDERHAAFLVRQPGETQPWRIRVVPIDGGTGITPAGDVVVNLNFASEGPSWEPSGRRLWFFSHEHRKQAYYPMVAAEVASGKLTVVDYPARCTTPNDLAVHPLSTVPEIALVAHDGLPQDLFIVLCNHY